MKHFVVTFILLSSLVCRPKQDLEGTVLKKSLSLVFQDEFDQLNLDTSSWNDQADYPAPFDKILPRGNCDFTNGAILKKENISLGNGMLYLIAKHENEIYQSIVDHEKGELLSCDFYGGEKFLLDQSFTSASVFSKTGYNLGYFECKAKIPCTVGLYPVFWLWHHDELVVFEFFGDPKVHFISAHNKEKYVTQKFSLESYCEDFHTYGVHWQASRIDWYLDDHIIWSICRDKQENNALCIHATTPFNNEYGIIESFPDTENRWLRPNISLRFYEWANYIDTLNLPDTLIIDYVKIYQSQNEL